MKSLSLSLALLITFFSWGQQTIKKTLENQSPPYKETYYVLRDNPDIKHGRYKKSYKELSVKGQFENNKRTGVWKFYDGRHLVQRIDFNNNVITNLIPARVSVKYWVRDSEFFKEVVPDEAPVFIGGQQWFYYYMWTSLRYTAEAMQHGIHGKVLVSAVITKEGKMVDEKVEKGLGYGLDEEALKVMQMIPDDWVSAKIDGQPVDIKILIPFTFH